MGIVIRQSMKAAAANYAGVFLGFLNLFILFPLFYNPTDLGVIRFLLETGVVIASFALVGTHYSINRFFPHFRTEDQQHRGFFFWMFLIPSAAYLLVLFVLLFFKKPLLSLFNRDAELLAETYPMLVCLVLFSLFQTILETANANHGRIAVPNFIREVVLRSLIIVAGVAYFFEWLSFHQSVWCMVAAYGLATLANLLYLRTMTRIVLKPDLTFFRQNPELKKDIIRFTGWLFLGGLTSLIVSKIDFIMISAQKDFANTAIYSIGFYLALMIEIPKRTILQISNPIIAKHMMDDNIKEAGILYRQISLNQLVAASVLFFFIWLNIDNLFLIMPKGDYYSQGKAVVFIIGISRLIDVIGSAGGPVLANSKYYSWGLINFCIAISVAIISNYLLIPILGINGAALATTLTFLFNHGFSLYIIWKKMGIHPFHISQLKMLIILGLFLCFTLTGPWLSNPYADAFLRSVIIGIPFLWLVWKLKISEELNQTLRKVITNFRKQG